MCGLFGCNLKPGHEVNMDKMLMLGVYNVSRGKEGYGYYIPGTEVKKTKDSFLEYHSSIDIRGTLKDKTIMMAHTRKSSVGGISDENSHPHVIDNKVLTHNGTILNIDDLLTKYDCKEKFNVDSKALCYLIKHKGFDILNEYIGFAAIALADTEDINTTFLYRGRSDNTDERPLFILTDTDGVYYSSIKDPLTLISTCKGKIEEIPANKVVKITKGVIDGRYTKTIKRELNNKSIFKYIKTPSYSNKYNYSGGLIKWESRPIIVPKLDKAWSYRIKETPYTLYSQIRVETQIPTIYSVSTNGEGATLAHGKIVINPGGTNKMEFARYCHLKPLLDVYVPKDYIQIVAWYGMLFAENMYTEMSRKVSLLNSISNDINELAKEISKYSLHPIYSSNINPACTLENSVSFFRGKREKVKTPVRVRDIIINHVKREVAKNEKTN